MWGGGHPLCHIRGPGEDKGSQVGTEVITAVSCRTLEMQEYTLDTTLEGLHGPGVHRLGTLGPLDEILEGVDQGTSFLRICPQTSKDQDAE